MTVARLTVFAVLAVLCVSCGGHAAVQSATAPALKTRAVPGEPGRQYEIRSGGYLYLLCSGVGSPTVILEAGLGDDHRAWDQVQPELARTTRVCSYDRSGVGFSQEAPKRATAQEKVHDLHALLQAANVRPPYVLVGHSYGGMLARVYASTYAPQVVGVVLIDSSHPDQTRRTLRALPPVRPGENALLHELRAQLPDTRNPEGVDWNASSNEARAADGLGGRPLIVITAGESDWPLGFPTRVAASIHRAWIGMQDDLTRLSSDSDHVIAVYSPHPVMSALGQPGLVLRAIRAVIAATRAHASLKPCAALFSPPGARCLPGRRR